MPIHKNEADFKILNGWDKFEDILQEQAANLFGLDRKSLI